MRSKSLRTTTGADYQARLNNPTAWTKRTLQFYRNLSRSLCEIAYSQGYGRGGYLQTVLVFRSLFAVAISPPLGTAHPRALTARAAVPIVP